MTTDLSRVRLCMRCRHREHGLGLTPCRAYPGDTLAQARALCKGEGWEDAFLPRGTASRDPATRLRHRLSGMEDWS